MTKAIAAEHRSASAKMPKAKKVAPRLLRESPVALHRQLAQQLRDAIRDGTYKPGDRIPTEPELAALHGVSRITARQAVLHLVQEGLVARKQGKGTFVSALRMQHPIADLRGFYDELVAQGIGPTTELLGFGRMVPPPRVAERLRSGAQPVVAWKRLYLRDNVPFAIAWVYLSPTVGPVTHEMAQAHLSYHIFEKILKLKIDHAALAVRAQSSTAEMRKLLRMRTSTPVLALERVSYLADDTPIEYALYCAHAGSYEFAFKVRNKVDVAGSLSQIAPN